MRARRPTPEVIEFLSVDEASANTNETKAAEIEAETDAGATAADAAADDSKTVQEDDKPVPPQLDFSGDWTFNRERSSDPDEMLKALGVPWIARTALRRATRTVKIDHQGLVWIEDVTTSVITRRTELQLDGSTADVVSPLDKTVVRGRTFVEEGGVCVATTNEYVAHGHRQVLRRCLQEEGRVYYVFNELTLGSGEVITTHNYFDRNGGQP